MTKEVKVERTCHYCGKGRQGKGCRCSYRAGRRGIHSIDCQNTSAQTTIGEMRKELDLLAGALGDETPAVWKFSYTTIDPDNKPKVTR